MSGSKDRRGHAGHDRTNFLPDSCGRDEGRDQGVPVVYDCIDCLRVPRIKLDFQEALESLLGKQLSDNSGRVKAIAEREAELVFATGSDRRGKSTDLWVTLTILYSMVHGLVVTADDLGSV